MISPNNIWKLQHWELRYELWKHYFESVPTASFYKWIWKFKIFNKHWDELWPLFKYVLHFEPLSLSLSLSLSLTHTHTHTHNVWRDNNDGLLCKYSDIRIRYMDNTHTTYIIQITFFCTLICMLLCKLLFSIWIRKSLTSPCTFQHKDFR